MKKSPNMPFIGGTHRPISPTTSSGKKDLRFRPRWLAHLRAIFGGYFWLPCRLCGENYGGFESDAELYTGGGSGWTVCANCSAEAKEKSKAVFKTEGVISLNGEKL